MANKKIQLNISERFATLGILNEFKGSLADLAIILEDIKLIAISEEEWKKADQKIVTVGDKSNLSWNDEKGGLKEIELQDTTIDYLRKIIKEKDEKKEFELNSRAIVLLNEKIK